jgi:diketogulonate reductase-like aldo/keto reductase
MEGLWVAKGVTYLGVSNIRPAQLLALLEQATIAPTFVQNRCYAATGWDRAVRAICSQNGIIYQGFSLLTANRKELSQEAVTQIARKYQKTIPQVVFRFCQQLGMVCLTGTSDSDHMREDLAIMDFELSESELHFLENMGVELD